MKSALICLKKLIISAYYPKLRIVKPGAAVCPIVNPPKTTMLNRESLCGIAILSWATFRAGHGLLPVCQLQLCPSSSGGWTRAELAENSPPESLRSRHGTNLLLPAFLLLFQASAWHFILTLLRPLY